MPAVLLLPWVLLNGTANQTVLSAALAGVSIGAAYALCLRLELGRSATIWLCVFLFAGTSLLWCAQLGDVWFIAHVSAVCFTLLALAELFGRRRIWIVALCAVCATESRFTLVLVLPVYAALLWYRGQRRAADWAPGIAIVAAAAGLWLWYNMARWGVPYDIGYTAWYHQDSAGLPTGSPFRLQYFGYELWSMFAQVPAFIGQFPYIVPSVSGVALTWTSPAVVFALFARSPRAEVIAMWIAAILTAVPNLVYYVNGFAQYGMRHSLDFMPFLFALMAIAARERLAVWAKVLVAYSVAASSYGIWFWNVFLRPAN